MSGKFVVSISFGKDNTDKATVGFVVANAAVASDKETVVFLSIEGTRLSQKGYADDIHEEGFAPLKALMASFAEAGGTISGAASAVGGRCGTGAVCGMEKSRCGDGGQGSAFVCLFAQFQCIL